MEGWNKPEVNRTGVMRVYVDEYDNHAYGILQEDAQNGFDAYSQSTQYKDMKIIFKYDADNRIFYYRDFKTQGMPHCSDCDWGIKSDGKPCTNDDCGWGCYHNLAYSGKSGSSLGSRGMGKSLRIESGERTLIRTTLPDDRYMASIWQIVDGDWQWKKALDDAKKLSDSGTEMITYNIKENVHNELLNFNDVVKTIQEKWFRLLEKNVEIQYILIKNGKTKRKVIPKLKYPNIEPSGVDKPTLLKKDRIIIKYHGKKLGELRNLELYLAKSPFKDDDYRQGIAIVKNGKQNITRYRSFPTDIPEDLRRRIFGHVDAPCEKGTFLSKAENSTHTGYQWTHTTYKQVRVELNKILRDFIQPFIRSSKERVTEQETREAKEILELINSAIDSIPELQIFGIGGTDPGGSVVTTPKEYPYISSIEPVNKRFNKGEQITFKIVIKNPLEREIIAKLDLSYFDPTPIVIKDLSVWPILKKGKLEKPSTVEETWTIDIDNTMVSGIHWIQAELKDKNDEPMVDSKGKPIKIRGSVYIELDPPTITRKPRTGKGKKKRDTGRGGDRGTAGFSYLQIFKRPDLPEQEAIIELRRGIAFINWYGRRFSYLKASTTKKKAPWLGIGESVVESLLNKKLELDLETGEEKWSAEVIKDKYKELDEIKKEFIKIYMEGIQ